MDRAVSRQFSQPESSETVTSKSGSSPDSAKTTLQSLLDAVIGYAIFAIDSKGHVASWSQAAERVSGYSANEILGKHLSAFYPAEKDVLAKIARDLETARSRGLFEEEGWRVRKDSSRYWAHCTLTPLRSQNGVTQGFASTIRDLGESRHVATETLRQSEERFRLLVQAVKDYAIFMLDPQGNVMSWNEGAERAKGYRASEIIGKHFSTFYTAEDITSGRPSELLRAAVVQGRVEQEGWRVRKDGTRFWADVIITAVHDEKGELRGFAKVTRDVTQAKEAQDRLKEKQQQINELQKVEAIGRLAGGIAHDFNNLIAGILGCAEIVADAQSSNPEVVSEMAEIRRSCERASTLTRQLVAYSRRQTASPTHVNINTVVLELQKLLTRLIGANVQIELKLADTLPFVNIDVSQLEQIVVNLSLNARDAMPEGGTLSFATAEIALDASSAFNGANFDPGDYIMLSVTDTGTGMSNETAARIFEPFFTTKEFGKGTGLGLSTVYGIVKQNNGAVAVASQLGIGTTLKIFLPAVTKDESSEGPASKPFPTEAEVKGGSEVIMVVEDDALVLRNTVRALQSRGYTVLSATNAEEAVNLFHKAPDKIKLVITDVVMPGMSGKQLALQLAELQKNLPIIFMSGYASDLLAKQGLMTNNLAFIEKPFSALALARKVRQVLDASSNTEKKQNRNLD